MIMRGLKRQNFKKNLPPTGGRMVLIFMFYLLKKAGCFQPAFFDFGEAEIGSFLILILYRNNIIFKKQFKALCVKGLS